MKNKRKVFLSFCAVVVLILIVFFVTDIGLGLLRASNGFIFNTGLNLLCLREKSGFANIGTNHKTLKIASEIEKKAYFDKIIRYFENDFHPCSEWYATVKNIFMESDDNTIHLIILSCWGDEISKDLVFLKKILSSTRETVRDDGALLIWDVSQTLTTQEKDQLLDYWLGYGIECQNHKIIQNAIIQILKQKKEKIIFKNNSELNRLVHSKDTFTQKLAQKALDKDYRMLGIFPEDFVHPTKRQN